MTTGVARMWYNHIWLIQLLETTFTSRYCTVPYFKTCNLTNGNWLCYCVSILCRRILTAEKPHRSCKNTVLQKIQHSSHILLIGVLLKSLTSSMVKIALHKLFAGILCGCVVLLVLVAKWVREKKTIQTYPYSNCTFHHQKFTKKTNKFYRTNRPRENFGQHNLLYVYLSACWKTGQKSCKNKHGENCVAQVVCWLVFCAVVWCCLLVAKWVREKNHPNLSIF